MRLGFAVSVLGRPRLKSHDGRRWQNEPHLSVSLIYLRDILEYLHEQDLHMYRMASQLAPYFSHPGLPQFHDQIEECAAELAFVGRLAADYDVRLSFHATPYTSLSATDPLLLDKSEVDLAGWARMLDLMGAGPEAVVVVHIGGAYGDREASKARFVERCLELPEEVRQRLVVENDDRTYSITDALDVARATGLRVVFDYLHFSNLNPQMVPLQDAVVAALATWPEGVRPKIHFSSPRTEMQADEKGKSESATLTNRWTAHSDFVNPFEVITLLRSLPARPDFDIMLEAKAKDLAVLRLRADIGRYAPDLAGRFEGIKDPAPAAEGED